MTDVGCVTGAMFFFVNLKRSRDALAVTGETGGRAESTGGRGVSGIVNGVKAWDAAEGLRSGVDGFIEFENRGPACFSICVVGVTASATMMQLNDGIIHSKL